MKKTILTLLFAVAGLTAFAQLNGGIKAGVNFAKQKYEASGISVSFEGTSFHVGGYLTFAVAEAISIQPELLYNSLKVDFDGDDITSNYLSVPVMFMYGFADNKFNVQAGPQLGILLSTDPSEYKDEDGVKSTDFSLNFGAGANFGKFNATIRYCLGLSDVAGDALEGSGIDSVKNNNLQLSVGYKLFGE